MKKLILTITAFLFIAFTNAQDAKTQSTAPATGTPVVAPENKNGPDLKFIIETYDFGSIKQGDKVTHDFEFTNSGKEPLIISSAQGSCGCTVPEWPKEPIAKGGKGIIHVEFNSGGKMGMQDKTVSISSNAKSGAKVLHLKGNVEVPAPATDVVPADQK